MRQPVPPRVIPLQAKASTGQLRVVCAWCRTVQQTGAAGADVSHAICPACEAREWAEYEQGAA